MKRTLLTGTALATAAMLAASPASAEVKWGANVNVLFSWADEDKRVGTADQLVVGHGINTQSEIEVKGKAKTDAGLEYGFEIELEGDGDQNASNVDNASDSDAEGDVDETSMYLKGAFGKITMGLNDNVTDREIDGQVYGVTGTQSAMEDGAVQNAAFTGSAIDEPKISNDGSDAGMIMYEAPRIGGVAVSVSYMPARGELEHLWGLHVSTSHKLGDVGVKLGFTGAHGDFNEQTNALKDPTLIGYNVGIALDWEGFKFETGYVRVHEGNYVDGVSDDDEAWGIGAGYGTGPWTVAVTYTSSREMVSGDEWEDVNFGIGYNIAKGLEATLGVMYAETTTGGCAGGANTGCSSDTTESFGAVAVLGMSF